MLLCGGDDLDTVEGLAIERLLAEHVGGVCSRELCAVADCIMVGQHWDCYLNKFLGTYCDSNSNEGWWIALALLIPSVNERLMECPLNPPVDEGLVDQTG